MIIKELQETHMKNQFQKEDGNKSIFDFQNHPYFSEIEICKKTGIHRYKNAYEREYQNGYFLEEYKNQYNKTYLEDELNLRNLAKYRLSLVEKYCGWKEETWKQKKILEIGCAYGFFLDEAKKKGANTIGIEISKEASEYGKNILGLNIQVGNFLDNSILKEGIQYDAIFSFFTIEHIPSIESLWIKIVNLLTVNGIIMLALPSYYGPTFQTNPRKWFETHPRDHFYDYSPNSLKKLFNYLGLKTIYTEPLSYHPNRDLGWKGKLPKFLYQKLAKWMCYGDTFQIIAKKY